MDTPSAWPSFQWGPELKVLEDLGSQPTQGYLFNCPTEQLKPTHPHDYPPLSLPQVRPGPSPDPFPEWHRAMMCLFPPGLPFPLPAINFSPFFMASQRPLLPAASWVVPARASLPW